MRQWYNVVILRAFIASICAMIVLTFVATPPVWSQVLDRGHRVLVERGLQLEALVFSGQSGDFDPVRWAESNYTTVNSNYYSTHPATQPALTWSRWLHDQEPAILDPANADLYPWELGYVNNLVHIDVKDEQDITDPAELALAAAVVDSFHAKHPNVIMNLTQAGSTNTAAELQNFMQHVEPDMLMFDTYPFNGSLAGGSPTNLYSHMEKYRKLGLAGNDGTGAHPIPTALYTQTYSHSGHVVSESEIRLNVFSALAFGNKLLTSFVYESSPYNPAVLQVLFDGPGTDNPTPQFYHVAQTNRQSLNLGTALVRLISTDVRMIVGSHAGSVDNDLPAGVSSWTSSADPYITSITATNLGSKNDGLRGDVIVGYFEPLAAEFTNSGHENDTYFMVTNGLTDPDGSAAECRQNIRLDFDFGSSGIDSLLRLSRDTGEVEKVALNHLGDSSYYLDLILDGGTGDLFKFDNGGIFASDMPKVTLDLVDNGSPEAGLHSYTLTATGPGITTLADFTIDGEVHQVFDEGNQSSWLGDNSASESETTDSYVIFGGLRLPDLGGEEWPGSGEQPAQFTEETITGGGNSGMGTLNNSAGGHCDDYLKLGAPSAGDETVELMQLVVADGDGFSIDLTILTSENHDPITGKSIVLTHDLTFSLPSLTPGDANGDGYVNSDDASILAQHWLQISGATWADGDFNGDGAVNDRDATLLAANWQGTAAEASVPEPSTLVLLSVGGLALLFIGSGRKSQSDVGPAGWCRPVRVLYLAAIACCLLPVYGCGGGSQRHDIQGTVTLDGNPLPKGYITFRPQPGSPGPTAGAEILDGEFAIATEGGTFAGEFRVEITASRPSGRKVPNRFTGAAEDEITQYLPNKYNSQSGLTAEVTADGPNRFEFDLDSQ